MKKKTSTAQPTHIEGPVTAAMRIGGCAMVCSMREDGTEFGYPIDVHQRVRRSTGVVKKDGTFAPPTSDYWLWDGGSLVPLTEQDVMQWDVTKAWKYRMSHQHAITKRDSCRCVFSLPIGVYGSFYVTYNGTTPVPVEVRLFKGNSARELAITHCSHHALKDGRTDE